MSLVNHIIAAKKAARKNNYEQKMKFYTAEEVDCIVGEKIAQLVDEMKERDFINAENVDYYRHPIYPVVDIIFTQKCDVSSTGRKRAVIRVKTLER